MNEKKPRELYNFKVHLWLSPPTSSLPGQKRRHVMNNNLLEDAKQALVQTAEERKIMYSSYGSPYEVHLEHIKATPSGPMLQHQKRKGEAEEQEWQKEEDDEIGLIEMHALAVAKRRRDLPRLSGLENGSSENEEEAADDEMKRQGYRVVKAHFKSSHCPLCGNEFAPGEHIAKPQEDHSRGGWAHSTCLANCVEMPTTPTKTMMDERGATGIIKE
jgi:hypothetical protein|eukprot:evm.model.NODE_4964_length_10373_cov_65.608406.1